MPFFKVNITTTAHRVKCTVNETFPGSKNISTLSYKQSLVTEHELFKLYGEKTIECLMSMLKVK